MDYTWNALIERAKNNDQQAFNELYQNSYDVVYRTVKSMVKDEDTALDIVQDAFIKAFANLSMLENPDNFLAWIKRIAINKAKDWFKKKHDISFSQLSDDEDYIPDFEDDRVENLPDAVIDRNETARLIEEILSTLSDEQRIAIGMFYYQDMSVAEIAQELEISENTVKSRLNYGRKKIKAGVEDLEKKGTKLYGLAPLPFLLLLFKSMDAQAAVSNAPAAMFGRIMAETASQASATVASGAASASTTAVNAGTAVAGKTGGGLFSSLGAKIIAGVLAVTLAVGGIGSGVYYATHRDNDTAIEETEEETTEGEEPEALSFEEFNKVFLIGAHRGGTYLIVSDEGDYQLYAQYSNGADEAPYEYRETGKFGNLRQLEDGSYEAHVTEAMALVSETEDTNFTVGNTVHFYPTGMSADVLDDNVWIGYDKTINEDIYIDYLEQKIDASGNFNQYVIWEEGDDAAFTATDALNNDERYFSDDSAYSGKPIFYDWDNLDDINLDDANTEPPTDGDRIVFSGTIGEYSYDDVVNGMGIPDVNAAYSDKNQTFFLIELDTPQTMELHSGSGDGFRSDEVRVINIAGAENLEQYYGQQLYFSIDPNNTYWPSDSSMPTGQPRTSDVHVLK